MNHALQTHLTPPAIEIRHAADRGRADFGWLRSRHTFSFGHYYDPQQVGFSDLLVINDDTVAGGGGFPPHPHRDMEIFSYVLSGALEHADSMGTGSVVRPGDVQAMSAGSGVRHSEFNHSKTDSLHFLQIWIVPDTAGLPPRYQQATFSEEDKRAQLRLILSPDGRDGSLLLHQDASVFAALLDGEERVTHEVKPGRYAYVHVARGSVIVAGQRLQAGDGARIREPGTLELGGGEDAEILLFDLVAREQPEVVR